MHPYIHTDTPFIGHIHDFEFLDIDRGVLYTYTCIHTYTHIPFIGHIHDFKAHLLLRYRQGRLGYTDCTRVLDPFVRCSYVLPHFSFLQRYVLRRHIVSLRAYAYIYIYIYIIHTHIDSYTYTHTLVAAMYCHTSASSRGMSSDVT